MNPKCIIFDLDGTLVDSELLGSQSLIDLLPQIDESARSLTERYRGKKLAEMFVDLERRFQLTIPAGFEPVYRAHMTALFEKQLRPCPGVVEMLERITNPRCIASSGPMQKIKHSLRITGLSRYFEANLFSAYDIDTWKPEPGLFLHAAREMGFAAKDCVVVEDSTIGVEAARSAGMTVFHYSADAIQAASSAYRAFSSMSALPGLLNDHEQST